MARAAAEMRPPRNGPMLRQSNPARRSGGRGVAAAEASSSAVATIELRIMSGLQWEVLARLPGMGIDDNVPAGNDARGREELPARPPPFPRPQKHPGALPMQAFNTGPTGYPGFAVPAPLPVPRPPASG